jgi:hypothetical protein
MPRRLLALREVRGAGEALLFARVLVFAAAVPTLMRLPLPRLAALLTRRPRRPPASAAEIERLERLTALAPRVGHPLVRSGCLTRGVTLFWFLRRAGLDVQLNFGLDSDGSHPPDGHCWLSIRDEPFLEKRDPRPYFTEQYRWPVPA